MLLDFYLNMGLKLSLPAINKKEVLYILLIILLSSIPRIWDLGYSHFYGDEIKVLYTDKSVPAVEFLMNQRKGPVQFITAWVMEKISSGYSEKIIRLPFAMAGIINVFLFYILVKKLFGSTSALISAYIFSLSGIQIAFSRTVQYQSFLLLFSFLSLIFLMDSDVKNVKLKYSLSSLFFPLALFSHYDAVFILIPMYFILRNTSNFNLKHFMYYFIIPSVLLLSVFYIPYVFKGYLSNNTINYVARRITGQEYKINNSIYTFYVYNPSIVYFIPIVSSLIYLLFNNNSDWKKRMLFSWFIITFFFFGTIVINPGTHINNYLLPLYISTGPLLINILDKLKNYSKYFIYQISIFTLSLLLLFILFLSYLIFIPGLNRGYPFSNDTKYTFLKKIKKNSYHLYLYGFPYNRGWDQISEYIRKNGGTRGFYTNDDKDIASYYLLGYDFTPPGSNYLPDTYIDVINNLEFKEADPLFILNYNKVTDIVTEGKVTASIYKIKK